MAVPKFDGFYNVVLKFLADGEIHTLKDCREFVKREMQLTDEDISETTSDGREPLWLYRLDWCLTRLRILELVYSPQYDRICLTREGLRKVPNAGVTVTNENLSQRGSTEMAKFINHNKNLSHLSDVTEVPSNDTDETPEEILERVHGEINAALSDELLSLLLEKSPQFFEKFTVKLMERMGYGIGKATQYSRDGGIDGIVYSDKLGFDRIGIQAKLWGTDRTVGTPEIQKFYGALQGSKYNKIDKGLFVTTARFSDGAKKYADDQHIILIDGKRLTELMIEFDVGVSTQKVYKIKRVDTDFFSDN